MIIIELPSKYALIYVNNHIYLLLTPRSESIV